MNKKCINFTYKFLQQIVKCISYLNDYTGSFRTNDTINSKTKLERRLKAKVYDTIAGNDERRN